MNNQNKSFSKKFSQVRLLHHFVWGTIALVGFGVVYLIISIVSKDSFYIFLEQTIGYDMSYLIHSYEPAVILFTFIISQLFVWIVIELYYSKKIISIVDTMDEVLNKTTEKIVLPQGFEYLENQLNLLKTQNREQQHLLEMEIKEKSDTLTYLAHDIRTPLASVVGYLSLLCEAPDMPVEQRLKYTRIAFSKALKFENLVDEFFDITRYSLSNQILSKKEVDLSFLFEQLADEFFPILERKNLQLDLQIESDLYIIADSEKIARVFMNVIKNAIEYSFSNSTITFSAHSSGEYISSIIENKGKTIPTQSLECLFDKFYRDDETRNSDKGGAGLGLAIAKEIIRLHGGNISVESSEETTRFIITLPIQP
ncbi:HAMP domain-containing histidine kinase [Bacillus sp. Bva_UNVM-123]|uniref:sensor histidine kinase n=1 Tax=Bacillus sp. Bva_UNVM-123 TaxID=2829798 RepID=UPI00391F9DFB